jgi:hypothetical protein
MERTRTWIKDGIDRKQIKFFVGQKVVVFRRKISGHPRSLRDGYTYTIKRIENDSLIVYQESPITSKLQENGFQPKEFKVHRTYLISVEYLRDEIINDILKD